MSTPAPADSAFADHSARFVMRKLPLITAAFWLIKITATTLGETAGDQLGITWKFGYLSAASIYLALFAIVVVVQLRADRFRPAIFWVAVALTSTAGTEVSDFLNRGFSDDTTPAGLGYGWGSVILTSLLAIVFVIWRRSGHTMDVENAATSHAELLYWVAVLISNSLGTSSGDFVADQLGVGYRHGVLVFAGLMLLLWLAHRFTPISDMVLFWLAFILTRPLGATAGDALDKPVAQGGQGWGTGWASVTLLLILTAAVTHQVIQLRRYPLDLLPAPVDRHTGAPQPPNGRLIITRPRRGTPYPTRPTHTPYTLAQLLGADIRAGDSTDTELGRPEDSG